MSVKNPGFTLIAVLSLAVGIGVNSTVFSFVNAILFKSISVPNNDNLVYVVTGNQSNPYRSTSYENYLQLRGQSDVFSGVAAYAAPPMLMTSGQQTVEVNSEVVSGNYFSVLDVRMLRGQGFTTTDDQLLATEQSLVVSENFWKRRLNSDPEILGKQLILNGNSFSIVGVASGTFTGTDPSVSTDLWVPITQWANLVQKNPATDPKKSKAESTTKVKDQGRLGRDHSWLAMIGRLNPGVSIDRAQVVMDTVAPRLHNNSEGSNEKLKITVASARELHPAVGEEISVGIFIMAVASLILMICCVNVASLMLSRAAARQKEFAIRIALGSSRRRLVRQLVTEALVLSVLGGGLGLVFAYWTTRALLRVIPMVDAGFSADIAIDQKVLLFSFVISLLTALIFGLLPALNSFRPDLVRSLAADAMSVGGRRRKINLRRALVVAQITASLVLLILTGLFLRAFQKGETVGENFKSNKILILNLTPTKYGYSMTYGKTFYQDLLARVGALPGVESVTLSDTLPLTMERSTASVSIDGKGSESLRRSVVAEGYFQTLNIPILRGRDFDATDRDSTNRVAIINQTMARTYWPNENPLGKVIKMGQPFEVVGVASDGPYNSSGTAAEPLFYVSVYQRTDENVSLIVRTSGEPKAMISTVQGAVKELGGNLPVFDFKTLDDLANTQLFLVKAAASLLSLLSLIGLLVASIGIYGVTAYAFSQRKREIGIRMSLGAQRSGILKLIMKEGTSLALVGIAVGVLLALGTTHFLSSLLYGISPVDPLVFFLVATLLAVVAVGASLVPAIMAARSNPVDALRYE
jgi:predicted permease